MKISAKQTFPAIHEIEFVGLEKTGRTLNLQTELRWLNHVLKIMLYINLVVAIASFGFSIHCPSAVALMSTGLLAVLAAITIMITTIQIRTNQNWTEVCIMTLCSLYAPFFVLWAASGNLLSVIADKI